MAKKKIPDFASEAEEAKFWSTHNVEEFADELEDEPPFKLAPGARTQAISLRLPMRILDGVKRAADQRGVGYQTLMKEWLDERLRAEVPRRKRKVSELVRQAEGALQEVQASLEEIRKHA